MTTQATGPSLRETLREVDAAIAEIIRAEVADPAERERLLAKFAALSQPAASLDVERLVQAILAADFGDMRVEAAAAQLMAERIAAEYARLQE